MRTYKKPMWPEAEEIYALAQRFQHAGGTRILVSEATAALVAHALRRFADEKSKPAEFEYGLFRVEVIGPYPVDKIQVVTRDRQIGDAAFDILVSKNPGAKVSLLHSSSVLRSNESPTITTAQPGKTDGAT
ncbi:hypothetical protein CWB41_14135 [Methylovirgula ligni]|uniref:Uncharacterized protein n=2 Tax=Methylovirgula ligni TaxID=569860 RepID=A0A3D9YL01_9HYPH|nr:hypothetical protein CWB41_14135 [Methylovirgula ligni]REF83226.1 hypothetical protein DES32_3142 [Methylovirgula ligni]